MKMANRHTVRVCRDTCSHHQYMQCHLRALALKYMNNRGEELLRFFFAAGSPHGCRLGTDQEVGDVNLLFFQVVSFPLYVLTIRTSQHSV